MTQLKTFGFIFEQMCVRDLKAYTPDFYSHISYYRDRYGLEADLVLHLDDGRYALIECKQRTENRNTIFDIMQRYSINYGNTKATSLD